MLNSLGQILPAAAVQFGDRIALVFGEREFSFRELDVLSSALARNLVALGVNPGDRVTLYAPNSWEWIVSYYGALKGFAGFGVALSCHSPPPGQRRLAVLLFRLKQASS